MKEGDEMKNEKKFHLGTMDVILIVLGIATLLFTLKMIQIFERYGAIPDTLVERYFTTVVGEAGIMGVISAFKIKYAAKKLMVDDPKNPQVEDQAADTDGDGETETNAEDEEKG